MYTHELCGKRHTTRYIRLNSLQERRTRHRKLTMRSHFLFIGYVAAAYLDIMQPINGTLYTLRIPPGSHTSSQISSDCMSRSPFESGITFNKTPSNLFPTMPIQRPRHHNITFNASTHYPQSSACEIGKTPSWLYLVMLVAAISGTR